MRLLSLVIIIRGARARLTGNVSDITIGGTQRKNSSGGCSSTLVAQQPSHVPTHPDVVYKSVGGQNLALDIYLPPCREALTRDKVFPAMMYLHPGAWEEGSKNGLRYQSPRLRRRTSTSKELLRAAAGTNTFMGQLLALGVAIVSIDYRLAQDDLKWPGNLSYWPAQGQDAADAIQWIRSQGRSFNLDPQHVGCWGESAGGHLCAWVGSSSIHWKRRITPEVVVNMFGPTCFLCSDDYNNLGRAPADWLFGFPPGTLVNLKEHKLAGTLTDEMREQIRLVESAEPLEMVRPETPPTFLGHGVEDQTVPFIKAQWFKRELDRNQVPSVLLGVAGGGHMYKQWPQNAIDQAVHFVQQYLALGSIPCNEA